MTTHSIPNTWLNFIQFEISNLPNIEEPAYPPQHLRFKALELTPPDQTKVIILGQDPYHGKDEANGLAFSVSPNIPTPPSLRNIFKELQSDLVCPPPNNNDLSRWAEQGVLLLNTSLSVAPNLAGSHANKGWNHLTDAIIYALGNDPTPKAFVLWGKYAQQKLSLIPQDSKHLILKSSHPSPLSAYRDFFGSKPFSKINAWLKEQHQRPINW